MIDSAADFVRLRTSEIPGEQYRAAHDAAAVTVWRAVIEKYPDMREWVARNKTVPIEILWGSVATRIHGFASPWL